MKHSKHLKHLVHVVPVVGAAWLFVPSPLIGCAVSVGYPILFFLLRWWRGAYMETHRKDAVIEIAKTMSADMGQQIKSIAWTKDGPAIELFETPRRNTDHEPGELPENDRRGTLRKITD